MSSWPHLDRAPITEALIDLQVELAPEVNLGVLEAVQAPIRERYPRRQARDEWRGQIHFQRGEAPQIGEPVGGRNGFMFRSLDDLQVVQARLDGFTFSRLKEYQDWQHLRNEARELWDVYRNVARPVAVTRVAVRYINRIPLPLPIEDLGAWLNTRLEMPGGLPPTQGFFLRLVIPFTDANARAIVMQTIEQGSHEETLPIIFDIDVFRQQRFAVDSPDVWGSLEDLREIKNEIFFRSLQPETIALFR